MGFVSGPGGFFVTLALLGVLGWVATTWIRARHGYPLDDGAGGQVRPSAAEDAKLDELRTAVEAQQAAIEKLEERVRVLERIVTDGASRLSDEIDRLRA